MGNTSVTNLSINIPVVYAVTAHFGCLVLFDELDADLNHRLRTARATCRTYRFFSVALAALPCTVCRGNRRFDALAASYGCAALIADARMPRPTSTAWRFFCWRCRNRTPGPPPFSSMNSTPLSCPSLRTRGLTPRRRRRATP